MLAHLTRTRLQTMQRLPSSRAGGSVDTRKMVEATPGRCPDASLVNELCKTWFSEKQNGKKLAGGKMAPSDE